MSDYTPTTEQVRGFWASDGKHQPAAKSYDEQEAADEFDRWLGAHDAEIRADAHRDGYRNALSDVESGAFISGAPWSVRQAISADAWDEGALWAAVETGAIRDENTEWLTPEDNPYRAPRPPAPELFPGVQERLDALSIRKEGS